MLRHAGLAGELVPAAAADLAVALHDIDADDVVVGMSLFFVFRETLEALRLAKAGGAATVVIAASARNPFGPLADHLLVAPSEAGPLLCSVVAGAAIVEELAAQLAVVRPTQVVAHNQALWNMVTGENCGVSHLKRTWVPAYPSPLRCRRAQAEK